MIDNKPNTDMTKQEKFEKFEKELFELMDKYDIDEISVATTISGYTESVEGIVAWEKDGDIIGELGMSIINNT